MGSPRTDPKDQHVLAAAMSGRADLLLTENVSDFDRDAVENAGMGLVRVGELLDKLSVATHPMAVTAVEVALRNTTGHSRLSKGGYPPKGFMPRRQR